MQPKAPIVALPLAPCVRQRMLAAGFTFVQDIQTMPAHELAAAASITLADADEVLRVAAAQIEPGYCLAGAQTALAVLQQQQQQIPGISLSASSLDSMLQGGVKLGTVTEFYGVPGVGKTQLGIQLAVNVQVPAALGGPEGSVIYIDTEGSFMIDRVVDIASAAVARVNDAAAACPTDVKPQLQSFNVESILRNITYFRVHDYVEQLAIINMLDSLVMQNKQVKLVIIDSITFHFRQDFKDMGLRTRLLMQLAQQMMALAESHNIAVVYTNQVTTKVLGNDLSQLVPALGESWGQAASTRVVLSWEGSQRFATVLKAPYIGQVKVPYMVTAAGMQDKLPEAATA